MRFFSLVFFLFMLSPVIAQDFDPFAPGPVPDRIVLSWSDDPMTTQSVTWRTDTTVQQAWAEIALANASPDFVLRKDSVPATTEKLVTLTNRAHYHSATFTGLEPNTKYAYRVGDGNYMSEWFHFETADKKGAFSFAYFGDAQNNLKSMWSRVVRQAYSSMPDIDFMLHAGDLVNVAFSDEEWGEWFYAAGWITGTKAQMSTPGNHEYTQNSEGKRVLSEHWRPTFTLPQNGPEGLEETVYYFDYQGVRFISLNTQASKSYPQQRRQQVEWLREVLEDNPQDWTIVMQHHPVYSTASGRDNDAIREAFQPIFEEYGVDLVLQGHDHTYGRGYNLAFGENHRHRGPMYVVSVSGPKMYTLSFTDWLERVASNTQLYQLVHVDNKELLYEAYTATGELYDSFKLRKKSKGYNQFFDLTPENQPEIVSIPSRYAEHITKEQLEAYRKRYELFKQKRAGNR